MTPSPETKPLLAIVIVAFEDLAALEICLASIRESGYKNRRIIVIDNSLTDTVGEALSSMPDVEYHRTGRNIGFSRACNLGIERSLACGAAYTLMLNPDTKLDPDCLEELMRAAESLQDVGIVGGKIRYAADPGRLWYAGGRLDYLTGVGKHFQTEDGGSVIREVTYATGCCMLIPNNVFRRVGSFKESIFMYLDDAEFCMRIRRNGCRIYYNPNAILSHAVGPGMDRRNYPDYYLYFSIRNKPLIAGGVYGLYLHGITLALTAGKLAVYGFSPGVDSRGKKLRALLWGAWDSLFTASREERRFPRLFSRTTGVSGG